ncbi:unnamed protein product [Bemisia tabaci]|uniref:Chemosensory protein n=1 Tax=Bemisia tabaci TaxID=7038 RepID=A0A9P0F4K1_BEMTA|nr:unnamed protein product [Bemisia tabaci]
MMKYCALSAVLACVFVVALGRAQENQKQVQVPVNEMLNNTRMREAYFKCMSDKGPCTPDAAELKKVLPEAMTKKCAACTDTQKKILSKILDYMMEKDKATYKEIQEKYDPKNEYTKMREEEIKKEKAEEKKKPAEKDAPKKS